MTIPINNIWFLLSYAWDVNDKFWINEKSALNSDNVITKNPVNSLAKRLIKYTSTLIRRGLNRGYQEITSEIAGVKGRIDITQTLKHNGFNNLKLTCNFDELNASVLHNQIIKTTLNTLVKTNELDKKLKEEIITLNRKLIDINPIILNENLFSKLTIHSNIKSYRVPIKICELIYKYLKPNQSTGRYDFERIDEKYLSSIFEKFILNFYKEHLKESKVNADRINWQNITEWLGTEKDGNHLPQLKSDIIIYNKKFNYKLIIDAKFYPEIFDKPQVFEKELDKKEKISKEKLKFKRDHIFQLYSYLKNFDLKENLNNNNKVNISGMLLYPLNKIPCSYKFKIHGYKIKIQTIDLDKDDETIAYQMMQQIKDFENIDRL